MEATLNPAILKLRDKISLEHNLSLFAEQKLAEHGLSQKGWRFNFNERKQALGLCVFREKTIYLSHILLHLFTLEDLHDVILHEIAHALTPGDHHGAKWRAACLLVGAKPDRCKTLEKAEQQQGYAALAKYTFHCPSCKLTDGRNRLASHKLQRLLAGFKATCGSCTAKTGQPVYLDFTQNR